MADELQQLDEALLLRAQNQRRNQELFRKWHVESLVNQIADLADRALKDRADYYAMKSRLDLYEIDRYESERRIALLEKQIQDGMFTIEGIRLDQEIKERTRLKMQFGKVTQHTNEAIAGTSGRDWSLAWARQYEAQIAESMNDLEIFLNQQQRSWETKNDAIRTISVVDLKEVEKRRQALLGSSLGWDFMIQATLRRIEADMWHMRDRLTAAQNGLDEIYDYFAATGTTPLILPAPWSLKIVDTVVAWVREVIRWLTAFGQLDQAWTVTLSIRELVGDTNFKKAVNGTAPAVCEFVLPEARFQSHAFARLRGMALFVDAPNLTGPMKARVDLPKHAVIRRPQVATLVRLRQADIVSHPINQEDLPSCHFGRVEPRGMPRAPEIVGLVSLMNASPISDQTAGTTDNTWRLELYPFQQAELKTCRDIHLELNLLGRTVTA
jgi:hypothetical protein